MTADMLIFKKKGRKTSVKITKGMQNGHTPEQCSINVNLKNYKDFAQFLFDLKWLWGVPIDKSITHYKSKSDADWLF